MEVGPDDLGHATHSLYCKNCAMQERRYPVLQVFQSDLCGFGLKACQKCESGTVLAEYTGEVITSKECVRRMAEVKKGSTDSFYFAALGDGLFLDAKSFGSIARFANHCCNPNSELQRWYVDGMVRLALVNIQPLAVGEEITYNYGYSEDGMEDLVRMRQKCHCGASNCCGTIGGKVTASPVDGWVARAALMLRVEYRGGTSKPTYTRRFAMEEFEQHLALAAELEDELRAQKAKAEGRGSKGKRKGGGDELSTAVKVEVAETKHPNGVGADVESGTGTAADLSLFMAHSPECRRLYALMELALARSAQVEDDMVQLREKVCSIGGRTQGSGTSTKCYYYDQTTSPTRQVLSFTIPPNQLGREPKASPVTPLLLMNRGQATQYLESFSTAATDGSNSPADSLEPIGRIMKIEELVWFGDVIKQAARMERRLGDMYKAHLTSMRIDAPALTGANVATADDPLNGVGGPAISCSSGPNSKRKISKSSISWSDLRELVSDLAEVLPIVCEDFSLPVSTVTTADESSTAPQPVNIVVSFLYNTVICDYISRLCNSTLHNTCVSMWRHYHCARKSYLADITEAVDTHADFVKIEKVFLVYSNIAVLNAKSAVASGGVVSMKGAVKGYSFSHFPSVKYHPTAGPMRELLRIPFEIRAWLDIYTSIYMNKMISLGVLDKRGDMPNTNDALSAAICTRLASKRVVSENMPVVPESKKHDVSYCYCCLPENEGESSQMVQCERCWQWYHHSCLNIDVEILRRPLGDQHNHPKKKSTSVYYCPSCCAENRKVTSFAVDNNAGNVHGAGPGVYEWGIPAKMDDEGADKRLFAVSSSALKLNLDLSDASTRLIFPVAKLPEKKPTPSDDNPTNIDSNMVSDVVVKQESDSFSGVISDHLRHDIAERSSGVPVMEENSPKKRKRNSGIKSLLSTPRDGVVVLPCRTAHSEFYFNRQRLSIILTTLANGGAHTVSDEQACVPAQTRTQMPRSDCVVIGCPIAQLLSLSLSYITFWETRTAMLLQHCADAIARAVPQNSNCCQLASCDSNLLANMLDCLSEAYYELRILKARPRSDLLSLIRSLLWAISVIPLLSRSMRSAEDIADNESDSVTRVVRTACEQHVHTSVHFAEIKTMVAAGRSFVEACEIKESHSLGDPEEGVRAAQEAVTRVYTVLERKCDRIQRLLVRAEALPEVGPPCKDDIVRLYDEFQLALLEESLVPSGAYACEWSLSKEYAYARLCNLYTCATHGAHAYRDGGSEETLNEEPATIDSNVAGELYCWCRRGDLGVPMVGCDGPCGLWFHCECMGYQYKVVEKPKKKRKKANPDDISTGDTNLLSMAEGTTEGINGTDIAVTEAKTEQAAAEPEVESLFYCISCSDVRREPYTYRW